MRKKLWFSIVVLMPFLLFKGYAQDKFKYQTSTDSVTIDGFYKIKLSPSILAKCKPTLADLRLLDINGKQVPYIIKSNEGAPDKRTYTPFKILERVSARDSVSKIIIENTDNKPIDNLVLTMQNSLADRNINISGSNNKVEWYAVKEFIGLVNSENSSNENTTQTIVLPLVHYHYYLIVFNEKHQNPLLVNEIGTYKNTKQLLNYFTLPQPKIIQHDSSNKYSYIQLIYPEKFRIDKLQLFTSGSRLYKRDIIFEIDSQKGQTQQFNNTLSSKNANILVLAFGKLDTLKFRIKNDDNPPLHVDSAQGFQDAYSLFAYLKVGQKYNMVFGNDDLKAPVYDLATFRDSISIATPILNTGIITSNNFSEIVVSTVKPSNSKIWLWVAIIVVLILLLLFTVSMLKQINDKQ